MVYAFQYLSCVYESAWCTVSLHISQKGAEKAMQECLDNDYKGWQEYRKSEEKNSDL